MAKNLKEFLTDPQPRRDGGQAMLFCVGGGYLLYLAYGIVKDVYTGVSEVSLTTAWLTAGVMAVAGIGVLLYALRLWKAHKKATEEENARLLAEREAREAEEADEAEEA